MSDIQYFTKDGLEKIKQELHFLKTEERTRITQAIAEARDKGDLSENAEYDAAKEAQGHLEDKIRQMETLIANAKLSLKETFEIVKTRGIGFRIEVSIRPHFSDPLRRSRHGNDLMLITSHVLKGGNQFTIGLTTFPTRSVETEALKLLSELTSMVKF